MFLNTIYSEYLLSCVLPGSEKTASPPATPFAQTASNRYFSELRLELGAAARAHEPDNPTARENAATALAFPPIIDNIPSLLIVNI
jgi:hypothetical protein